MMSYANYMSQNPYYQQYQMYPNHFVNALQQNYGIQQPQLQPQTQQTQPQPQQQQQQQITTQPPIMQPQINAISSRILPVTNKEEATVAQVDLINGTPSFFFNKSNGEIYLKQFDVSNGTAIFKTYNEIQPPAEEPKSEHKTISNYDKEFNYLIEGVDNLHRMIAKLQQQPLPISELKTEPIDIDPEPIEEYSKSKSNKKRGQ